MSKEKNIDKKLDLSAWNSLRNIGDFDKHIISFLKPNSPIVEQYRILKAQLFQFVKKTRNRIFLITSAVRGEGKTLTSVNLSISLAWGLQDKVFLIDGDLRKPHISKMFNIVKNTKGLSEYLTSEEKNFRNFVSATPLENFDIITSGAIPRNPTELLESEKMVYLINELKKHENLYVIIDSPPLISVSDPVILSSLVDGIIVVIRAFNTPKKLISEAINKIEDKKKILGIVLNDCKNIMSQYTYY